MFALSSIFSHQPAINSGALMEAGHSRKTLSFQDVARPVGQCQRKITCPVINTDGVEEKQMGRSVRSLSFLLSCFHLVDARNLSRFYINTFWALPFFLIPHHSSTLCFHLCFIFLTLSLSLSLTHTHTHTHTQKQSLSPSLRCVLPDSGLLCTVQSSVYESLAAAQT